jgi:hypothetical protein
MTISAASLPLDGRDILRSGYIDNIIEEDIELAISADVRSELTVIFAVSMLLSALMRLAPSRRRKRQHPRDFPQIPFRCQNSIGNCATSFC